MKDSKERIIHNYFLFLGIALVLLGIISLVYSTYPLGTWKAANMAGGPGTLVQIEIPKSMRISDAAVVRVSYEFSVPPDINGAGQITVPVVYRNITITLQTVSFDAAPPIGKPIAKRVKNEVPYEWSWVVKPEEEGRHYIILQFTGISGPLLAEIASYLEVDQLPENSTIMSTLDWPVEKVIEQQNDPKYTFDLFIPIPVVNVFGLTSVQAKATSVIMTFLGSGLTLTWLYEQRQKQRSAAKRKRTSRRGKRKG